MARYLVFILLLSMCVVKANASFVSSEDILNNRLEALLQKYNVPGAVLTYGFRDEPLKTIAVGYSDVSKKILMSASTLFVVGSISKSFLAAAMLQLYDQKKLSLDSTMLSLARQYKGELAKLVKAYPQISHMTIRQLLNHTSGIPEVINTKDFTQAFVDNPTHQWSDIKLLELAMKQKVYFYPGEPGKWSYTNTDYILLGLVIETITRSPIDDAFLKIWKKADLNNIYYPNKGVIPIEAKDSLAAGYVLLNSEHSLLSAFIKQPVVNIGNYKNKAYELKNAYNIFAPSSTGIIANSIALAKWYRDLFQYNFLPADVTNEMLMGVKNGIYNQAKYALGVTTHVLPNYGLIVSHDGLEPGYSTIAMYLPKYKLVVVLATNSSNQAVSTFNVYNGKLMPGFVDELLPIILHDNGWA